MKLYRIEHQDTGLGPFSHRCSKWAGLYTWRNHHPSELPAPRDDGLDWITREEICSCRSITQLRKWFYAGHLRRLDAAGFVLRIYEVKRGQVRIGGNQCLARRTDMRLIGAAPVTSAIRRKKAA